MANTYRKIQLLVRDIQIWIYYRNIQREGGRAGGREEGRGRKKEKIQRYLQIDIHFLIS